jgi:hypothetical protein
MRFVMNPTLRQRYPEDDEFGKDWLEQDKKLEDFITMFIQA